MTTHWKLILAAVALVLAAVTLSAYVEHKVEDAKRDIVMETAKEKADDKAKDIEQLRKDLSAQLATLAQQKQTVITQPQQAPTIIRETIPFSTPIQQTAPITKETLPDAPVAQLTRQQEQELAGFALSCRQCTLEKSELQAESQKKDEIIQAKDTELKAAMKAAKGGSVWQRTMRGAKWFAIGAAAGVAYSSAHHH